MTKHRRKVAKFVRRRSTGIYADEFNRLGWDWEASWFVKSPRSSTEYANRTVAELYARIDSDIREITARAYSVYEDEWKPPLHWSKDWLNHWVRSSGENRTVPPRIWARLHSNDSRTAKKAEKELTRVLQLANAERKQAADALVRTAVFLVDELRSLCQERESLMSDAAKRFKVWPVNLGVELEARKDRDGQRKVVPTITGYDAARDYLFRLGVNSVQPVKPVAETRTTGEKSLFSGAAQSLYGRLQMIKRFPRQYFLREFTAQPKRWLLKVSPWGKELAALSDPMTRGASADAWWRVAKVLVDELWERNHDTFKPLKCHLKLDNEKFTPSHVKSRVVDDELKKAFKSLAIPSTQ